MHPGVALLISYASGSIPAAWLAGKSAGVDLRKEGSGNLGATNVLRVLGPGIGAAVFAVDVAKGAVPVYFVAPMTGQSGWTLTLIQVLCGAVAMLGHARPMFLGFTKGGKGVATACGVFLALAPWQAGVSLLTFAVVVYASGFVSLVSMSGAIALPVALIATYGVVSPLVLVGLLTTAFVTWTHRPNIERLRAGTEYQFSKALGLGIAPSLGVGALVLAAASTWLFMRSH